MGYLVNLAARAERDLISLYLGINAEQSDLAWEWYTGLKEAVLSLGNMPNRCPLTREKGQLRHLLYGQKPHVHRVIFRVLEKQKRVEALHIRHCARKAFKAFDLG